MSDNARKETILSETKLRMYAPALQGADRQPVLIPDIFENNPRLRVRTNVPNDANKGYIEAAMNSKVFSQLMEGIRKLANNELFDNEGKQLNGFRIENFGHPFLQGQRSKDKRIVSITSVEKNEAGVIKINLSAGKNRPMIDFVFLEDDYHHFKDLNGTPMSQRTASALAAIAWANMMEKYVAIALTEYITPAWILKRQQQEQQGGNANGGYQQRSGQSSGGGYQQSNQSAPATSQGYDNSFDIDIPL